MKTHNSNHKGFTGGVGDWLIVHQEVFNSKEKAFARKMIIKKKEKQENNGEIN